MKRFLLAVALTMAAVATDAPAQSMQSAYDAMGRLKCVKYANGKVTKYVYDPAGNRVSMTTTASGTCQGQAGGETPPVAPGGGSPPPPPPPPPPGGVTLTTTNPTSAIASQGVSTRAVASLGSASDSATLTIQAAVTGGAVAGCGTVSSTASSFTYTAPLVTPVTATRQCWVDYTLAHPNTQTVIGRATYNVSGEEEPGGDPGGPGGPGCQVNCGNEN